ncbi:hypothetical protein NS365_05245 [Aureimonas ureilytica]|uniref:Uncharacterized protein n=1 Tax=Aureimonas ureilytica TaxID=401562 RepID=A0A175RU93_9HYPH|nr:hypothetical protein [Aureimonas ureilytica]KTR07051.1 hypothetical protein NS365_05245 [Aureimonas ureilytica]
MFKLLHWFFGARRSSEWEAIVQLSPVKLDTGEVCKEVVMTRWINGARQYRRATEQEVADFVSGDAW